MIKKGYLSFFTIGLMLIIGLLSSSLDAEEIAIIEDIKIDLIKEPYEIRIASNIAIEYLDYTLEEPSRIIIDPLGAVYCNLDKDVFSGEDLVREVSIIRALGDIPPGLDSTYYPLDFIVIELRKPVYYSVLRGEKLVVQLSRGMAPPAEEEVGVEEAIEQPEIEIAEAVELEVIAGEEFFDEEEAGLAGEEFFDEEKFPAVERYKIEPGDGLEISVWQHPDLLRKVIVRPDGFISFPLAGDIDVSGLTVDRVAREIALRLSRILKQPEVSVIVTDFGSKGIFVLGAVNKPGLYPYTTKMTALRAISLADSWQSQAYLKNVLVVKRFLGGDTEVIRVNLWDVIKKGDITKDVVLQAGDIVYVPQSFIGNIGTFLDGLRLRFSTGTSYGIR